MYTFWRNERVVDLRRTGDRPGAGRRRGEGIVREQRGSARDLAGQVVGATLRRLDWVAWGVFISALGLSWGSRWLAEFQDRDGIGPLRLWSATLLVALLMCFASSFILSPKLVAVRARMNAPVETFAQDHPDRVAYQKVHSISRQMLILRMLLALGLAVGVGFLPKADKE